MVQISNLVLNIFSIRLTINLDYIAKKKTQKFIPKAQKP